MTADPQMSVSTSNETAICTLFEGDYHLGLAALVNSLVCAGFVGVVWAGYRGNLPPWLNQLQKVNETGTEYFVTKKVRLAFVRLETDIHLTNYKPQFMLDLLSGQASHCNYLWYFDPDITIVGPWSFFKNWERYGIALCQEIVDNILPANSPLRNQWKEIATLNGLKDPQPIQNYYNGGMVGVAAEHIDFLLVWKLLIEHAKEFYCDLKSFMPGGREMPFHASDQDALNIAVMYTRFPLSTLGPQGMGFIHGDVKMFHTVGAKPWRGSILLRAFAGNPPSGAIKFFFSQVTSPIRAYSPLYLAGKRLACSVGALMGRFYRRL